MPIRLITNKCLLTRIRGSISGIAGALPGLRKMWLFREGNDGQRYSSFVPSDRFNCGSGSDPCRLDRSSDFSSRPRRAGHHPFGGRGGANDFALHKAMRFAAPTELVSVEPMILDWQPQSDESLLPPRRARWGAVV